MAILGLLLAAAAAQEGEVDRMWTQFNELKKVSYTRAARIRLYADTQADFERFLRENPGHADGHTAEWRIIQILLLGRADAKARERIDAFLKAHPGSPHLPGVRMEAANILLRANEEEAALAALEEFLERHPDDERAFGARMRKGIVLRNLGRHDEAERTFRAVRSDYSDRSESWGALLHAAVTQQAADKTTAACRTLEEVLRGADDESARETATYYLSQYHRIAREKPLPKFAEQDPFGTTASSDAFTGRVGVIYFFDPTRNLAAQEAEFIRKTAETFKDREVTILGVCIAPIRQRFHNFRQAHQPSWTMFFEGKKLDGPLARGFDVRGLPALHVIDRRGTLRHFNLSGRDLENALEKLLKEK